MLLCKANQCLSRHPDRCLVTPSRLQIIEIYAVQVLNLLVHDPQVGLYLLVLTEGTRRHWPNLTPWSTFFKNLVGCLDMFQHDLAKMLYLWMVCCH